jgi:hypothetical protein
LPTQHYTADYATAQEAMTGEFLSQKLPRCDSGWETQGIRQTPGQQQIGKIAESLIICT